MLVSDILRLATRMFRTNRSRTILTILGISVGIGAILFLVSFGYGLQELILGQITTSDALLSLDVTVGDLENLRLNNKTIEDIKNVPNIEKISPLVSTQAGMMIDDLSTELVANFVDSDYFRLDGTVLSDGEFYTEDPSDMYKIIISSSSLQLFNMSAEEIMGKDIRFNIFFPNQEGDNAKVRESVNLDGVYRVIGIIDEEGSNYVYLPLAISQKLELDDYSKIKVKVSAEEHLAVAREEIMSKGFTVEALSDTIEQANQIFKVVQIVLASFGIVALIVSAIGMFNTMTIALLERTQEIGIMKALGATSGDIWKMFLAEAVIIGFFGGAGGIMIGMMGGEVFNYAVNLLAGVMGGEKIDMFYTPSWFIILIMTFSTVVGLLTGFYPAKRAAKINALEALRYK